MGVSIHPAIYLERRVFGAVWLGCPPVPVSRGTGGHLIFLPGGLPLPGGLIVFVSEAMDNPHRERELLAPQAVEPHPGLSVVGKLAVAILVFRYWQKLGLGCSIFADRMLSFMEIP